MGPIATFFVALAVNIVAYALMPKPKMKPPAVGQAELPSVEEGTDIPVIFGTVTIKQSFVMATTRPYAEPIKEKAGK